MAARRVAWERPFLDALRSTGVVSKAYNAVGVDRTTVYSRRNRNADFREAWDAALNEALDAIEFTVMSAGIDGTDLQTARWVLSRRRPDVWGDKADVTLTGPGGGPLQVEQTVHLPDPETWAEIIRIRTETETETEGD